MFLRTIYIYIYFAAIVTCYVSFAVEPVYKGQSE